MFKLKKKILVYGRGLQANFYINKIIERNKFDIENIKTYKKFNFDKKKNFFAAIIAASTKNQYLILSKLIPLNIKILCEKPFTNSLLKTKKIKKLLNKSKSEIFVNYQYRFEKNILKFKTLIKKKKLGKIKSINVKWYTSGWRKKNRPFNFKCTRKYGGVLREYGSHIIDYFFWLTDNSNSSKKIDFKINKLKSNIKFKFRRNYQGVTKRVDGEDIIFLKLNINSTILNLYISRVSTLNKHVISIVGHKAKCSSFHHYPFRQRDMKIKIQNNKTKIIKFDQKFETRVNSTKKLFNNFCKGKNNNIATINDAIKVNTILNKCYEKLI